LVFRFAWLGDSFFGTLLFALGAISNIFPARTINVVPVFLFQALVVFKSYLAIFAIECTHDGNLLVTT
jgi:hypothetical protein